MVQPASSSKGKVTKIIPMVIIGVALVIIAVTLAVVLLNQKPNISSSVVPSTVSFKAPEIVLNAITGENVKISDYRDKIVLINNWATWCPPCKDEMPVLSKYYLDHKDQGFMLFGIEAGDPKDAVSGYIKKNKVSFPILLDPNTTTMTLFKNDSLPSSYVIDHDGNVVLAWSGPISLDMLEKYVTPLLEQ